MSSHSGPKPPPFTAEIVSPGSPTLIRASGELDIATVDALRACFDKATGPVEVDMTGVTFIDSTGLRALIMQREAMDGDGSEFVVVPSDAVRRLITIAGLADFIHMRDGAGG